MTVTGKAYEDYIFLLLYRWSKIYSTGPKLSGPADQQQDAVSLQDSVEIKAKSCPGLDWAGIHHCVLLLHPCAKLLCSGSALESPNHPSPSRESCEREQSQQQNLHPGGAGLKLSSGFG